MAQIGRLRIFHSPDKLTPDKNAGPVEPGYHTDISAIVRLRVEGEHEGYPRSLATVSGHSGARNTMSLSTTRRIPSPGHSLTREIIIELPRQRRSRQEEGADNAGPRMVPVRTHPP